MSCHAASTDFPESPTQFVTIVRTGSLDYILCLCRAVVDRFQPDVIRGEN